MTIAYGNIKVNTTSEYIIEQAKTTGVTIENFTNLLDKLNDTPYYLKDVNIKFPTNGFVPLKIISSMKRELIDKMTQFLNPIQERRKYYEEHPELVDEILLKGTNVARKQAKETIKEVKESMKINYYND